MIDSSWRNTVHRNVKPEQWRWRILEEGFGESKPEWNDVGSIFRSIKALVRMFKDDIKTTVIVHLSNCLQILNNYTESDSFFHLFQYSIQDSYQNFEQRTACWVVLNRARVDRHLTWFLRWSTKHFNLDGCRTGNGIAGNHSPVGFSSFSLPYIFSYILYDLWCLAIFHFLRGYYPPVLTLLFQPILQSFSL